MRPDAFTVCTGLVAVGCGAFALWQVSTPAARPPERLADQATANPPAAGALAASLARLTAPQTPPAEPMAAPPPQRALRLIGVMETDQGRVAVIEADGVTLFLRPGEAQAGVTLVELDPSLAVIETGEGERRLSLGG
jgi:hypothetical protein